MTDEEAREALRVLLALWEQHGQQAVEEALNSMTQENIWRLAGTLVDMRAEGQTA